MPSASKIYSACILKLKELTVDIPIESEKWGILIGICRKMKYFENDIAVKIGLPENDQLMLLTCVKICLSFIQIEIDELPEVTKIFMEYIMTKTSGAIIADGLFDFTLKEKDYWNSLPVITKQFIEIIWMWYENKPEHFIIPIILAARQMSYLEVVDEKIKKLSLNEENLHKYIKEANVILSKLK